MHSWTRCGKRASSITQDDEQDEPIGHLGFALTGDTSIWGDDGFYDCIALLWSYMLLARQVTGLGYYEGAAWWHMWVILSVAVTVAVVVALRARQGHGRCEAVCAIVGNAHMITAQGTPIARAAVVACKCPSSPSDSCMHSPHMNLKHY
jgi:hypothetical protein